MTAGKAVRIPGMDPANLPRRPGVYIFRSGSGEVLYVGKARSLRDRVRSHFCAGAQVKEWTLASRVADVEIIPVASDPEALLLENRLIKEYQPRYNTDLKDGKSYPLLKITREPFPSVRIVREEKQDDAVYFGPFTNARLLRQLVKFLRRYYPVRTCTVRLPAGSRRVCTQYHIGRCGGPCAGRISRREYGETVRGLLAFFEGRHRQLRSCLRRRLEDAVRELRFEDARVLRDRLFLLEDMKERIRLRPEPELVSYGKTNVLARVAELLQLGEIPAVIEAFDVSDLGGTLAVGSKVCFAGGHPSPDRYRRYRVKGVAGADDYGMLSEVLSRRFDAAARKGDVPDLILIDGGRGHLSAAVSAIRRLGLKVPVIALAKRREEVYVEGRRSPLRLPGDSPVLHLFQRLRDEAHRFALRYHRTLRTRGVTESLLDGIPGLGRVRRKRLIRAFPDVRDLAKADEHSLKEIGIPAVVAGALLRKAREENEIHR